ncbi:AAA family ATPase [Catellatospora tritici]|uniref:AAA family ATPase n=1 Tax=Catellatospora tritici TaxID=2851566 RepID=UPI001C2D3C2A|nr:P-loop NTPase [Catellatospora tritici]MBV1852174.1 P-loop NTPase [Catellatospora tritici]
MTIIYEREQVLASHLRTLLGDAAVVTSADALIERINADRAEQLVLFGPGAPLEEALGFAEQSRRRRPQLGVLLLRGDLSAVDRAQALESGVRDVADPADHAAVLQAVAKSLDLSRRQLADASAAERPTGRAAVRTPGRAEPVGSDGEPRDGQVVTVFSAKGGCGKSTVAINLALALAHGTKATGPRKVCLIDLDLAFGDVAIMMQLSPAQTIADAVPVADRIDETGLRALLTRYAPSGSAALDVLLAPVQPALAEEVTRDLVTEVVHLARGCFDFVVLDTASAFTEQMLAALDATHQYVLVTTPELPSLKNLRVVLDMFDLLDYRREARTVLLNRADSKVGLSLGDIERVVRMPIAAFVPSSRDVPVSANRGVPLMTSHPQHPVSAAIRELAVNRFLGTAESAKRGLFARKKG